MAEIDIISVFGRYAKDYGRLLRSTAEALKSKKHKLNWLAVTTPKFRDIPKGWTKVLDLEPSISDGAIIHAEGLMEGLKISTASYVIFSDTDIALLARDWDEILFSHLSKKCPIVGFEYGLGPEKYHYQGFPSCTFSLFDSEILKSLSIDLHKSWENNPDTLPTIRISDEKEAMTFGKQVGEKLILETGWRIPVKYKKAGYKGYLLKKILPSSKSSILTQKYLSSIHIRYLSRKMAKRGSVDDIMHEYFDKNTLFATHMRRSRKFQYGSKIHRHWLIKIKNHFRSYHKIMIPELKDVKL